MLLDLIIEYTNDDAIQFADALTFTIGGAHTTGSRKLSSFLVPAMKWRGHLVLPFVIRTFVCPSVIFRVSIALPIVFKAMV